MKPYYDHAGIQILHGNALSVLRELPDESVNCCVTSPPYWGLRDYSTEPIIWDGDSDCVHNWKLHIQPAAEGTLTLDGNSALRAGHQGSTSATMKPKISNFCSLCGAWKGSFGLEPNPELYIQHSVAIFCEVKRVLRPDGTLWVNIGDSYAREGGRTPGQPRHWDNREKNFDSDAVHARSLASEIGLKQKDLIGIPWMLAFALRADGWYLRSEIIWSKPSPMPESVLDRPTKAHEQIFLLSKKSRYFYNAEAIKEPSVMNPQNRFTARANHPKGDKGRPMHRRPEGGTGDTSKRLAEQAIIRTGGLITGGVENSSLGISAPENRNKRSVWEVATKPFPEAHFAVYPEELIKPCVLAGCPAGGVVLDPFGGAMTTKLVAQNLQCKGIAIELNAEYIEIGIRRLSQEVFDFI